MTFDVELRFPSHWFEIPRTFVSEWNLVGHTVEGLRAADIKCEDMRHLFLPAVMI
jgi:hypothetical protein